MERCAASFKFLGGWRTEGLSEEGLEAVEGHVHQEPPSPSDQRCVESSQLLSDQALLGTLEEEGVRRRPIWPQVCVCGGEWPTPGKLGGQFQEEPKSGSLLRPRASSCSAPHSFKEKRDKDRRAGLRELSQMSQEFGGYDAEVK